MFCFLLRGIFRLPPRSLVISAWNPYWHAYFSNREHLITRHGQVFSGGYRFRLTGKSNRLYVCVLFFSNCWFCYPSCLRLLLMEKIYITFSLYFLFEMDSYCIVKASKMEKWIFLDIWHIFSQPLYICRLFCLCYKCLLSDFFENILKEIN